MPDTSTRTALVTGASSGLGLEAAFQLARAGYTKVIITARTTDKADGAPGPLHTIDMEHLTNPTARKAMWRVTNKITGASETNLSETEPSVASDAAITPGGEK